jgi:hypothetical protein
MASLHTPDEECRYSSSDAREPKSWLRYRGPGIPFRLPRWWEVSPLFPGHNFRAGNLKIAQLQTDKDARLRTDENDDDCGR